MTPVNNEIQKIIEYAIRTRGERLLNQVQRDRENYRNRNRNHYKR